MMIQFIHSPIARDDNEATISAVASRLVSRDAKRSVHRTPRFTSLHRFAHLAILAFMTEVTRILNAIEQGDPLAARQLLPLVYDELRRLAAQQLVSEKPGQTLNATALVHEAYLRLAGKPNEQEFANRRHFYAAAAEAMRRILVDNARRKRRLKHGGGLNRQPLDVDAIPTADPQEDMLDLAEALEQLAIKDPIKAKLVELRSFGGLTMDEAAAVLDISPSTADRYWTYARAWLFRRIRDDAAESEE
jgi:RNA polymerase sigma factor (TIGR02999 family)